MKTSKIRVALLAAGALAGLNAVSAKADTLTLNPVASFPYQSPFGLAFDGSQLWVNNGNSTLHEVDPNTGLNTGNTTVSPAGWSALAWSGTQLDGATAKTVYFFDKVTGANQSTVTLNASNAANPNHFSLIDGLDVDNGGEIFWSPDVSPLNRYDSAGNPIQEAIPVPPSGGFSGEEFVHDAVLGDLLVVVNDAFAPRHLTVARLDGTVVADAAFANARYEDLAFDGNFLYAADFFGNKIDKYGLIVQGRQIGNNAPDASSTVLLLGASVLCLLGIRRKIA